MVSLFNGISISGAYLMPKPRIVVGLFNSSIGGSGGSYLFKGHLPENQHDSYIRV